MLDPFLQYQRREAVLDPQEFIIGKRNGATIRAWWFCLFCLSLTWGILSHWILQEELHRPLITVGNAVGTLVLYGAYFLLGYMRLGTRLLWVHQVLGVMSLITSVSTLLPVLRVFPYEFSALWSMSGLVLKVMFLRSTQRLIRLNKLMLASLWSDFCADRYGNWSDENGATTFP